MPTRPRAVRQVLLVRKKTSSKLYALKAMVKSKFVRAETAARVLNENEVMQSLRHPFIKIGRAHV